MKINTDCFADIVLLNGKIYALNDKKIYSSLAIKGKEIIAIGYKKDIYKYIDGETKVIDLDGKIVLPSFSDTHTHAPGKFLIKLYDVYLYECSTVEEYMQKIRQYLNDNPKEEVIYGAGWNISIFSGEEFIKGPRKERLDEISLEKPIIIWDSSQHTAWLNSKAFEVFDITKDMSYYGDIAGNSYDKITKNENGGLWGCVKEEALGLVPKKNYTKNQYIYGFEEFQKELHSYGVTNIVSISDANTSAFMKLDWYKEIIKENKLKLRIGFVEYLDPMKFRTQIEYVINEREKSIYNNEYFKILGTKIFIDGVVEGRTAYLTSPYEKHSSNEDDYYGELVWNENDLKEAIKLSNRNNLQVHLHSIGDGATKLFLEKIEELNNYEELPYCRNVLIHLQMVRKQDIKRMYDLDIVAAVQPYWHVKFPGYWEVVDYYYLGERAEYEYPLNSLIDAGLNVSGSSDCPVTIYPNPLMAIQAGVTRNLYNAKAYGQSTITNMDDDTCLLNKFERASVIDMIRVFTINGAIATFREDEIGTIEVGKKADLIVLDKNILEINPLDIENTNVIITFFNGKIVYNREY